MTRSNPAFLLRRGLIAVALTLSAAPALAQTVAALTPPPAAAAPVRVTFTTTLGDIVIEVYPAKAPITAANFLRYVDEHRYDGVTFYRAVKAGGTPYGLVQGGARNDPARILPPIAHESTMKTGLYHVDGTVSMARFAPGTATSDFFICVGEAPYLDADPSGPGDNAGFAAFGKVVKGMDVARKMLDLPKTEEADNPVMKGQMLAEPVKILSAKRGG